MQYENEHVENMSERLLRPLRVNKTRRQAFTEYYEVVWRKLNNNEDLSELTEYVTLEKPDTFEKVYPRLVDEYRAQIEAKKTSRSKSHFFIYMVGWNIDKWFYPDGQKKAMILSEF